MKLEPEILDKIEQEIKGTVQGIRKILSSPLSERCLLLLIQDAAPLVKGRAIGIPAIRTVLEGIENLERVHIKPKKEVKK